MTDNQTTEINATLFLEWVKEKFPNDLMYKVNADAFFLKALFEFIQEKNINPNAISVDLCLSHIEQHQQQTRTTIPALVGYEGYKETVAELMNRLQYAHKDLVVLYERIDDSYFNRDTGWKTYNFSWGEPIKLTVNKTKNIDKYLEYGYYIKNINGEDMLIQEVEYIASFSSYIGTNQKGEQAFCIHANY